MGYVSLNMNGNIFIKNDRNQSLDAFVSDLPVFLGCSQWEQRQSSNYVEERYFRSFAFGMEVVVAMADNSEFDEYDFWLFLERRAGYCTDRTFLDGVADCIAWRLATFGYTVIRPYELGKMLYRPLNDGSPRETVIAEEV